MEKGHFSFIGDYTSRADAKNRIVLPSAFKRELDMASATCLIVKKDIFEKCLLIYPRSVWDAQMIDLQARIDPYNRHHAQFLREFLKNTCELSLDANGRLLVPQRLMDLIGASKDVSFLGVGDHIELWDSETYSAVSLSDEQRGELADSLFGRSVSTCPQ